MKQWLKSASIRAIKTVSQTAIATIGVNSTIGTVDWKLVVSTSIIAGLLSVLTSLCSLDDITKK